MGRDWGRRKRSRALVRAISPNFENALANYFGTGPTDVRLSQAAHDDYVAALEENGVCVDVLSGIAEHPDCTFVEDTVVIVDDVAVITNMGHHSREGEQVDVELFLSEHLEIVRMPEGALMDGGDVVFFDDRFLVGLSTRTNKAGAAFLREVAAARGYGVMEFEVPDSTLHLTTVCSSPVPGVIVAAEGHLTQNQFQPLLEEGFDVLWVPNEESYGSNMIGFENGNVIVSEDYPVTRSMLEGLGYTIRTVDMEHIRAADGSLTCLSVFFQ
ncbi:MAG: arginine deiminase-related protein [Candidatus Thermoplasmatota archaeon]|nr:arginine deiminase-related protein [Candidatus Thermoplasmatota archaeon]